MENTYFQPASNQLSQTKRALLGEASIFELLANRSCLTPLMLLNYRATNAYGGYVRSEKVARVNRDGEVISFEDYIQMPLWMQ